MRRLFRTDGSAEDLPSRRSMSNLQAMIGATVGCTVTLRHMGNNPLHVMICDDLGHQKGLPVNEQATKLYWANCRPGTTHEIRGDVVVVPDMDFS